VEGFGYGGKKQSVGLARIGEEERVKDVGDGEDDMMILRGQQSLLLRLKPAYLLETLTFRTVAVPARSVRNLLVSTLIALLDVTAQSRRSAVGDGSDNARLLSCEAR
jgi:hypothetical protein